MMTRRLFWKLCFVIVTGTVALFYVIHILSSQAEEGMSYIAKKHQDEIRSWGAKAESLYLAGNEAELSQWIKELQEQEQTWVGLVETEIKGIAGSEVHQNFQEGVLLGRDLSWKIHLYFSVNPTMEVTFSDQKTRFLIRLPERMRPGSYLGYISIALQIILPMILLIPLTMVLYRHIMSPLRQLERATRSFSRGDFEARVTIELGNRNDELAELAKTFDQMAGRTSGLIQSQRQLISDLSHELRTPLTRLDLAIECLTKDRDDKRNIQRINSESKHIHKLVEDTLSLAWLENEQPKLQFEQSETLDLVDLLDVLISDARFEFPDRIIKTDMPEQAEIRDSNHRAVGQALENILRNALRYTPEDKTVSVRLVHEGSVYLIEILDQGPGIADRYLDKIFQPFFRVEGSRDGNGGFGLGLALAKRHLESVGGKIQAKNGAKEGLMMAVSLPDSLVTN